MARRLLFGFLIGVGALVPLCSAAPALANTYSWELPTASAPGPTNPDADSYGATPWSYLDGATSAGVGPPQPIPTSFQRLDSYSQAIDGGLTGWQDSADPQAFVAANRSGSPVGLIEDGQLAIEPAADRVAAIGWTSPLSDTEQVQIGLTIGAYDSSATCLSVPTWTIEQDGAALASGTVTASATKPSSFTIPATVGPGDTVYLTVDWSAVYNAFCDTVGVALSVQAPSNPPTVTLASPGSGATVSAAQPTFSGSASSDFGDKRSVTVRVYKGVRAAGATVEQPTGTISDGQYSLSPKPPLANGTYTAQAEQDDLAGDSALSAPVTFKVHNTPPKISLSSPGSTPLRTSTPTLRGVAGNAVGDAKSIELAVWPGGSAHGSLVRYLVGTRDADGRFAIKITPALLDGRYTAEAAEEGAGAVYGLSKPVTFTLKAHPPVVTVESPASGARLEPAQLLISGVASTALGDARSVTVNIYRGSSTTGSRLASVTVSTSAGRWLLHWTRPIALGVYTVDAVQTDDAGHVATSRPHTFRLLAPPQVIGSSVTLDSADRAHVAITCTASAGACTGQVTAITTGSYTPVSGGPTGHLRVIWAYVAIQAGATVDVSRSVPAYVASALRGAARHGPVTVRVTATLHSSAGGSISSAVLRTLRITG